MTTRWFPRGYDRHTSSLGVEHTITPAALTDLRNILPVAGDADLIGPSQLGRDHVPLVGGLLGIAMDPDAFDYFIEAEEDWRVVAARREARFLSYVREADVG